MLPTAMELRIALRTLRRSKAFAIFSILALALAIAANTTMSSLIDGLIFPKVSFPHPDRLVVAHFTAPHTTLYPSVNSLQVLGDSGRTYSHTTWWQGDNSFEFSARIGNQTRNVAATWVSGNFFTTLGSRPLYGTLFVDSSAADQHVAVITDRLWHSISWGDRPFAPFGADLDGATVTVIGVVAANDVLPLRTDLFLATRPLHSSDVLIRMRPAASRHDLQTEIDALAPNLDPAHSRFAHFALRSAIVSPARNFGVVGALAAATLAVLLIACANIANLLLARSMSRSRELATRLAFGASKLQVARLLFAESGLIAIVGGAVGLVLSLWTIHLVSAYMPGNLQRLGLVQPQISWRVIAVGVGLTTVSAMVFALAPMMFLLRRDVSGLLKGVGTRHATANRSRFQLLVVVEVAGALILVVSASLLGASAAKLAMLDLGYDDSNLVLASVRDAIPLGTHAGAVPDRTAIARRYDELQRLQAMPGVAGATATWVGFLYPEVRVDDPAGGDAELFTATSQIEMVATNYLRVMKIPVIRGRDFHAGEDDPIPSVIIDETAAHWLWPNADPLGRLLLFSHPRQINAPWMRVVGIIKPIAIDYTCGAAACQSPTFLIANGAGYPAPMNATHFILRGTGPAGPLVDRVRRQLVIDAPADSSSVFTLREALGITGMAQIQDFVATLFGSFALVGLLLALIGVYGVAAYAVERRAREFGVRIALGAQQRDIIKLVLRDGNATALLGLATGLLAADWVAHLLQAFLLGVSDNEPWCLAVSVVLLFAATIAAGVPAALRAARVNPVDTLRAE